MLKLDEKDSKQMLAIQQTIAALLNRINREDKPEAALVAFAMARLVRDLIDNYNPAARSELAQLITLYIERADVGEASALSRLLIH